MFACIYGQVVPRNDSEGDPAKALTVKGNSLVELAFTFSPLVEQTAVDTIVLDIEGQEILFGPSPDSKKAAPDDEKSGWTYRIASEIVRLQKLVIGKSGRHLVLVQPPVGFDQSLELEHPVAEVEPLSFILSRLLNQLCASLNAQALATNELHLRLKLGTGAEHERTI